MRDIDVLRARAAQGGLLPPPEGKVYTRAPSDDVEAQRNAIVAAILAQTASDRGTAGGFSPGAGAGASQMGDASSIDTGALFGGSTPGYGEGAPGPGMGIGRSGTTAGFTE